MEKVFSRDSVLVFLRGLLMGMADIIPGVSGGTIAFITGIYPQFISALNTIRGSFLVSLLRGRWGDAKRQFHQIDFPFLVPLGFGILLAVLLFSRVITSLLGSHPAQLFSFFFGLIAASALVLLKDVGKIRFATVVFVAFGILVAFSVTEFTVHASHSLPIIFGSGIVAISAMLLPGISGSLVLLLLNQYEFILTALHTMAWIPILVFSVGAFTGLVLFSRFLKYLLHHYKTLTISFLIGLMLGSLKIPYERVVDVATFGLMPYLLVGFVLVFVLENYFKKR